MGDIPTRIERLELRCSDPEASAEFYSRLVGLEVVALSSDRAELRAPAADEPCLALARAQRSGRAPRRAAGLFHTAFRYRTRGQLAAALGRVAAMRAAFTGAADHGVSEALYLDDPDGLGIELYRDRPRDDWPEPEPGSGEPIRMFTEPLDLEELAGAGVAPGTPELDIGHVHLKVADTAAAESFWIDEIGMELMTRFGPQASFVGADGYHHHVGVNTWQSLGAGPEPIEGPGLARLLVRGSAAKRVHTPDGIPVEVDHG